MYPIKTREGGIIYIRGGKHSPSLCAPTCILCKPPHLPYCSYMSANLPRIFWYPNFTLNPNNKVDNLVDSFSLVPYHATFTREYKEPHPTLHHAGAFPASESNKKKPYTPITPLPFFTSQKIKGNSQNISSPPRLFNNR